MGAIERANAERNKREQQIDADYLRVLGMLQTKSASNPALAQQIAAEKAALISKASGVVTTAKAKVVPGATPEAGAGKDVSSEELVNGNFADIDDKEMPVGWKPVRELAKGGALLDGVSVKAIMASGSTFLRLKLEGRFHNVGVGQDVKVPNRARMVTFKFRYRGKITGRSNEKNPLARLPKQRSKVKMRSTLAPFTGFSVLNTWRISLRSSRLNRTVSRFRAERSPPIFRLGACKPTASSTLNSPN